MRQVSVPSAQKCRFFFGEATEIAKRGAGTAIRGNPEREGKWGRACRLAGGIGLGLSWAIFRSGRLH